MMKRVLIIVMAWFLMGNAINIGNEGNNLARYMNHEQVYMAENINRSEEEVRNTFDYRERLTTLNDIISNPNTNMKDRDAAITESMSIISDIKDDMAQTGAYIALAMAKSIHE